MSLCSHFLNTYVLKNEINERINKIMYGVESEDDFDVVMFSLPQYLRPKEWD